MGWGSTWVLGVWDLGGSLTPQRAVTLPGLTPCGHTSHLHGGVVPPVQGVKPAGGHGLGLSRRGRVGQGGSRWVRLVQGVRIRIGIGIRIRIGIGIGIRIRIGIRVRVQGSGLWV